MKLINLFSGPGAGKSTTAAGLFFIMKNMGYSVELITEYAKDKVYEGHLGCLTDQIYIFGKQQRRCSRLIGHVEYAITDSPLLLSILYNRELSDNFNKLVKETHDLYENINFFIERVKPYSKIGRTQTQKEAEQLDDTLLNLLTAYEIPYFNILGNEDAPHTIFNLLFKEYQICQ